MNRSLILVLVTLLSACGSTTPVRHYVLEAQATSNPTPAEVPRLSLGEIVLPDYLNRSQIVRRETGGRLLLNDVERWAEPLADGFRRILAENLARQLGGDKVTLRPLPANEDSGYSLTIDVHQFEAGPDGQVTLTVHWSLRRGKQAPILRHNEWRIRLSGNDSTAIQTAMNEALRLLGEEIVRLVQKRP